ncbi:MAG: 50S ribosomal protein L23 [Alphaproteobacteria bacterium]|nr:50S ribosomal protein L23 [Alphaproteobacteria bacterium]
MSKTKKTGAKLLPQHYQVILSPVITEKASNNSGFNQVTFRVAREATKPAIKTAVEQLFQVKVKAVNTHNRKGKIKRFRGRVGQRSDVKFAVVTLAEGSKIDVTTGV